MGPYAAFARLAFDNILAYRGRYVVGIFTYLFNVAVYTFIWRAVFARAGTIEGYTAGDLGTYVAVGWVLRSFYFNTIDRDIADDLAEGRLAILLSRPVDEQLARLFRAGGESTFRILFFSVPTAIVVAAFFQVGLPAGPVAAAAFLLSAALSFLVMAAINFAVGLAAIGTRAMTGILRAKYLTVELLSGLLIPLALFPDRLRELCAWLPFRHVVDTPVNLYLGKYAGTEAATVLVVQALWAAGLLLLGRLIYKAATPKISIAGG